MCCVHEMVRVICIICSIHGISCTQFTMYMLFYIYGVFIHIIMCTWCDMYISCSIHGMLHTWCVILMVNYTHGILIEMVHYIYGILHTYIQILQLKNKHSSRVFSVFVMPHFVCSCILLFLVYIHMLIPLQNSKRMYASVMWISSDKCCMYAVFIPPHKTHVYSCMLARRDYFD